MSNNLILNNVGKRFGDFWVLRGVRVSVPAGKITAFIGPNGAGKTTLLHIISGALRPDEGAIRFGGTDIGGLPCHRIARMGIGRQFQDVRVFGGLTVLENVALGGYGRTRCGASDAGFLARLVWNPPRSRGSPSTRGDGHALD